MLLNCWMQPKERPQRTLALQDCNANHCAHCHTVSKISIFNIPVTSCQSPSSCVLKLWNLTWQIELETMPIPRDITAFFKPTAVSMRWRWTERALSANGLLVTRSLSFWNLSSLDRYGIWQCGARFWIWWIRLWRPSTDLSATRTSVYVL